MIVFRVQHATHLTSLDPFQQCLSVTLSATIVSSQMVSEMLDQNFLSVSKRSLYVFIKLNQKRKNVNVSGITVIMLYVKMSLLLNNQSIPSCLGINISQRGVY